MSWNYCHQPQQPHAKAVGRALSVSHKHAREISAFLRGQALQRAKTILTQLQACKQPIPFKRHGRDVGHKRGPHAGGRYPVKAGKAILDVLQNAESNAQDKGLSIPDLYVAHIVSQRARRNFKPGRQGRRRNKSTHVEIILMEGAQSKTPRKTAKAPAKEQKKASADDTSKIKESKTPAAEKKPAEAAPTSSTSETKGTKEAKTEPKEKQESKAEKPSEDMKPQEKAPSKATKGEQQ